MSVKVTSDTIIEHLSNKIDLTWVTGRETASLKIHNLRATGAVTLIGHLNLIHKNKIQVIGKSELKHISDMESSARIDLLHQLFSSDTVAIIVSDALEIPDNFKELSSENNIPLLRTDIISNKLIDTSRYYLSDILVEKKTIHGVFMEVLGVGVLITGASSIGKSELALDLITRGHRLIADDAPEFTVSGPDVINGKSPKLLQDFMEVRGLGVMNIREMYGDNAIKFNKHLRFIIHMERMNVKEREKIDRLHGAYHTKNILGVEVPEILLPVAPGRNLSVLVEAAVRNHILQVNGHSASQQLIDNQLQALNDKQ